MFWKILNRFQKKSIFFRKFSLYGHVGQKWLSPRKNFKGKFFRYQLFRFKICFETFWIDSEKIFFRFFFRKFSLFLTIFVKKWLSPRKKFQGENFFDINFFGLKYVLKHSESIPKKNFFENFFSKIFTFWPHSSKNG